MDLVAGSLEEVQAASHDELPLTYQAYLSPSGMYLSYPAMETGEFSKDGKTFPQIKKI